MTETLTVLRSGGRLSVATLLIASAAATAAALITSRLWAHGAILSTAITPLIVAIVSELLHRPADRVAQHRADRREANGHPLRPQARQDREPRARARDHVHLKPAIVTAAAAFAIAAAVLTLPELIFGGAVATNQKTTLFGGRANRQANPSVAAKPHPVTTRTTATTRSTPTTTATRSTATTPRSTATTPRTVATTPLATATTSLTTATAAPPATATAPSTKTAP